MSKESFTGLGSGLKSLLLEGNQLEDVPDFSPLTGLEVINLAENPLLCDCPLLHLRKYDCFLFFLPYWMVSMCSQQSDRFTPCPNAHDNYSPHSHIYISTAVADR